MSRNVDERSEYSIRAPYDRGRFRLISCLALPRQDVSLCEEFFEPVKRLDGPES